MSNLKSTAAFNYNYTKIMTFNCILLEQEQNNFPHILLNWDKLFSLRELNLCAIHFRRKTYCRLQVVHSACIWKRHCSTLTHVSDRVGRGKLTVQSPKHLTSSSFLINLAFKPLPDSLEKYDILSIYGVTNSHLSTPVLSAVAAWKSSSISQNQVISPRTDHFCFHCWCLC